ncbi:MAG: GcrA family cell cycle regulator [Armatimonadia bacterium]
MADFEWTDQAVEELRQLHHRGLSSSKIARALGCPSRNAVLGKIMRLRDRGLIDGPVHIASSTSVAVPAGSRRASPGLAHVPLIKSRLSEGCSDREIAFEIGIAPDDVRYVRRIKKLKAGRRPKSEQDEAAARELDALLRSDLSHSEVAQKSGLRLDQVRYRRGRLGLTKPKAQPDPRITNLVKGDPMTKVLLVFSEGFMGQSARIDITGLDSGVCHYPIDQLDGSVRFCGAEAGQGQVYCSAHAARCFAGTPQAKFRDRNANPGRR